MTNKKMLFCLDCGKNTPHVYTGKESLYEGCGIVRGISAIITLGMSETCYADRFWQCEVCGRVEKTN